METSSKKNRRRRGPDDVPLLGSCLSSDSHEHDEPASFVEDWLMLGGKGKNNSITTPTKSHSPNKLKSYPRGRGRSPSRPRRSPQLTESPELRKTRSLEPNKSPTSSFRKSKSPIKTITAAAKDTPGSAIVESPIPAAYIKCIVTAFGADADLYKDVLGMEHEDSAPAPAKLRVAYFRRGRQALQKQKLSSPVSTITGTDQRVVTSKQQFRAVTKAYEILTNPEWKAYYEEHGLAAANDHDHDHVGGVPENQDFEDDIVSIKSGISILRSNSWGPSRSRSRSSSKLRWKEEVEELIYQPDREESESEYDPEEGDQSLDCEASVEVSVQAFRQRSVSQAPRRKIQKKKKTKHRCVIDSPELNSDLEKLDNNFKRDFLDDFEAGMDGLEAKIGSFVKYALSDTEDDAAERRKPDDTKKRHHHEKRKEKKTEFEEEDGGKPPSKDASSDNSFLARELFQDLTKPSPPIEASAYVKHQSTASALASWDSDVLPTPTAPLKKGNVGQPRVKPSKTAKPKKRIGSVSPTAFDPFSTNSLDSNTGDADQDAQDRDAAWAVPVTVKAKKNRSKHGDDVTTTSQGVDFASSMTATTERGSTERSLSSNMTGHDSLLDYYEVQQDSSILASVQGDASTASEKKFRETGFDFGPTKTWSFDDALNTTTEATTRGFVRLERYTDKFFVSSPENMDTSDVTFASKDSTVGRQLQDMMNGFTKEAQDAIRVVSPVQETNSVGTTELGSNSDEQERAAPGAGTGADGTFLSSLNGYMQSLVDDVSMLGSRLSTNLEEANRAVVETMAFPEFEVGGLLAVLQSEFSRPDNTPNDSPDDPPNDRVLKAFTF